MSAGPYPYNACLPAPQASHFTSWPGPQPRPAPLPRTHSSDVDTRAQPDQSPTPSLASTHPTEPQPSPDLAPQPALLEDAIEPEPATYAESCGAKSTAPPKRSMKATTLPALACTQ